MACCFELLLSRKGVPYPGSCLKSLKDTQHDASPQRSVRHCSILGALVGSWRAQPLAAGGPAKTCSDTKADASEDSRSLGPIVGILAACLLHRSY